MKLRNVKDWLIKYSPEHGGLVTRFYVPALECAVRDDPPTGFFSTSALALAVCEIEGLMRNVGRTTKRAFASRKKG